MANFLYRPVGEQLTVGQQLRQARERRGWSLTTAGLKTNIHQRYLKALEEDRLEAIPGSVYVKNYIRTYATKLGVDAETLLALVPAVAPGQMAVAPARLGGRYFWRLPLVARWAAIGVVIAIIVGYIAWRLYQIVSPPNLQITWPPPDFATNLQTITIEGSSNPQSFVTINGQDIPLSGIGDFKRELYLQKGYNSITITARKKYGRTTTKTLHILVENQ